MVFKHSRTESVKQKQITVNGAKHSKKAALSSKRKHNQMHKPTYFIFRLHPIFIMHVILACL